MLTWILLLFTLIFAASMVGCGLLLWKCPPKDINSLIGYRTKRSMRSQEAWDFSQRYAGKAWVGLGVVDGLVFIPLSCLPFPEEEEWVVFLFLFIQVVVLLLVCPLTERALKRYFYQ